MLDARRHDRTPEDSERYADALAALLAEHRPHSLADAAPLLAAAERAIPTPAPRTVDALSPATAAAAHDGAELPEPGLPSLIAFAALPI